MFPSTSAQLPVSCWLSFSWPTSISSTLTSFADFASSCAQYPTAYKIHNGYCKSTPNQALVGTCQLIPPQQQDYEEGGSSTLSLRSERRKVEEPDRGSLGQQVPCRKRHWIACLFTSIGYGKPTKKHPGMDKPDVILENTRNSLIDLKEQILKLENEENEEDGQVSSKGRTSGGEDKPGELWCCKFNSGLFAVEWTDTREVLEEELKSLRKTIRVVSPAKC